METKEIFDILNDSLNNSLIALEHDLSKINLGRAQSDIFDLLKVNYYGSPTPLNHIAIISVISYNQVNIQPYDKSSLKEIEKTIRNSNLNLNPQINGDIIYVNFPQLTLERRDQMIKLVKSYGEKAKVSVRDHRREALREAAAAKISQNELVIVNKQIEATVKDVVSEIEDMTHDKVQELNRLGQ